MRRRRRSSGGLPRGPLLADQLRGASFQADGGPAGDPLEDLRCRRPGHFSLEDLLDELRERPTPQLRPADQFPMKAIRDVPHLDHLGHVDSMSHVDHMVKLEPWTSENEGSDHIGRYAWRSPSTRRTPPHARLSFELEMSLPAFKAIGQVEAHDPALPRVTSWGSSKLNCHLPSPRYWRPGSPAYVSNASRGSSLSQEMLPDMSDTKLDGSAIPASK